MKDLPSGTILPYKQKYIAIQMCIVIFRLGTDLISVANAITEPVISLTTIY